jgi:hypothetical protein
MSRKTILEQVEAAIDEMERRHNLAVAELITPLIRREFERVRAKNPKLKRILFGNGTYLLDGIEDLIRHEYRNASSGMAQPGENPFPRETASGAVIENERCLCGHLRTEHESRLGGLAFGHGVCSQKRCECERFTWKETVKEDPPKRRGT